jgi:hypothetical protein
MKKLLALGIALVMVMTMTAAVFAAVTVVGDYTLTYDFNAQKDKNEVNFDFSGKNNDVVSWMVRTKLTDKNMKYAGVQDLWMNEAYFTIKQSYGTFQLGMWEVKTYNTSILDNGDSTFGKLKGLLTVGYTAPQFFAGFIGKVVYFRDNNGPSPASSTTENDAKIPNADGAYVITLGYAAPSKKWGFDYNIVDTNMNYLTVGGEWIYEADQDAGYALNIFVYPLDNLRLYAHIGQNSECYAGAAEYERMIGGAYISFGKWFAQGEYNFEEINTFNAYGYKLGYNFTNSITAEWRHSDKSLGSMGAQELRIMLKFK